MKARAAVLVWLCVFLGCGEASKPAAKTAPAAPAAALQRGLITNTSGVESGYVLFSPLLSSTTYLIDNAGRVVHLWQSATSPGGDQILLADGSLLRLGRDRDFLHFRTGGVGGVIERLAWDGEALWSWRFASEQAVLHHDIELLPNGNVLALAWEAKTAAEAAQAGRRADRIPKQGLWPEWVLEVEPQPPSGGRIVWEWHVWDHLAKTAASESPGKLDINADSPKPSVSAEELAQLKALGYVPEDAKAEDLESDFLHANSVDYNAELDQIALSVPRLGELWILDHGTTSAEAASSSGGKRGRGGEILYRWGNPAAYGRGGEGEQILMAQHDVRWIPEGLPGAGRLTIFNNSAGGREGKWSSVDEIEPPLLAGGTYALSPGEPFAPRAPAWRYIAEPRSAFFGAFISGAHRTANGNTLICSGPEGRLFEVTPAGQIVWEYRNPFVGNARMADGTLPQPVEDDEHYAVFRATRIPPDHPALAGKVLAPLEPQPEIAEKLAE